MTRSTTAWRLLRQVAPVAAVAGTIVLFAVALAVAVAGNRSSHVLPGLGPIAFACVGAVIVRRQPSNRIGWLLGTASVPLALLNTGGEYAYRAAIGSPGSLPGAAAVEALINVLPFPALGLTVALLPQLFPSGAPISRRWRPAVWSAWGFIVAGTVSNLFISETIQGLPDVENPTAIAGAQEVFRALEVVALGCLVVAVGAGVAGLIVRWRRSAGDERQQLKWFLAGLLPTLIPITFHDAFPVVAGAISALLLPLVPITIGVAVLRYRLYDLDIVVRRVVVYAALTATIAAVYLAIVVLVELVAGWGRGLVVQVVATVVAAALFQPLHSRVQRGVDRLFFGDRARPYEALTRLGRTLEHAAAPRAILHSVVGSVAEAMRVPYLSIEFVVGGETVIAAEHGTRAVDLERFPMIYVTETIGHLAVSRRRPGEDFTVADRRLLGDLARHAGVAARAVQVTTALEQARLGLVTAREEERRRLRRDLHDGLGPALAGVTLGLHAARATIDIDAARAATMLDDIEAQVEDAVRDIRRLVYGLRPPALDQYGLCRALQQYAAKIESEATVGGLRITVHAPIGGLRELPAAVEVAAYRIATEAIVNVSRHAKARECRVRIDLDGALHVDVSDDGQGLGDDAPTGVGLNAMRERAAELGGRLSISSSAAGTCVSAHLPIPGLS